VSLAAALDALLAASWARAGETTRSSWPEDKRLDGAGVAEFLRRRSYAVLATTRADGRPHLAPVSYALAEDASLWLPTAAGAVRTGHVARQPWASFALLEGEDDAHVAVLADGPVRRLPLDAAAEEAARADVVLKDDAWVAEWLVLTPERLLAYAATPPPSPA
jgi:nitroimidazol reductase NimA-like FMN-containing flavoprotein (pyridoxamine 5'-phosphate oxidase superfamily)